MRGALPEKPIYDIPGHPKIDAAELIAKLEQQAAPFNPTYHLAIRVEKLTQNGEGWRVETNLGTVIEARAVVIAAGCGAFGPEPGRRSTISTNTRGRASSTW